MMKHAFSFVFLFFFFTSTVLAITDDFTVLQMVGEDTDPPTAPPALIATPIATTQINLSWGASTDDFLLEGYQVFRDSVQIATTTLTAYSDTGLTASTTYSYFIRAYDSFFNVSSSSNSSATTTFQVAPTSTPPVVGDDGGGNGLDVKLVSFEILPEKYSAQLKWSTDRYAQFELRWGRTDSYELGFVTNELYKREHTTSISDLEPGTTYEYQLIAYDRDGDRFVLSEGRFKTETIPDTFAPSNVSNLRGTIEGTNIRLTWNLPPEADFSHVRIVRSHLFYPSDPYDGFLAYQGADSLLIDRNAASKKNTQYYTVFSYDDKGNVSSGAILAISPKGVAQVIDEEPSSDIASSTFAFTFDDVEILQEGKVVTKTSLRADLPLTIRIKYDVLPEHLKTITATFFHPDNKNLSFSFLMRINKDKSYYEASIAPLKTDGLYPVTVSLFDHKIQKQYQVEGTITVLQGEEQYYGDGFIVPLSLQTSLGVRNGMYALLLLVLLVLFRLLWKAKNETTNTRGFGRGAFMSLLVLVTIGSGIGAYIFSSAMSNPSDTSDFVQDNEALSIMSGITSLETETLLISVVLLLVTLIVGYIVFFRKQKKK